MEPDNNSTTSISSTGSRRSIIINDLNDQTAAAASLLSLTLQSGGEMLDTPRKQRRKRLRRLAVDEEQLLEGGVKRAGSDANYVRRLVVGTLLIALSIAALLGHLQYGRHTAQSHLLQHFMSSYRKHYNQIVHGRVDYCSLQLDTQTLFARIRQQPPTLLHQEKALQQLEVALRNDSNKAATTGAAGHFNAVAVVGPVGVGKSLWARALEQHFPWRENVHTYAWNTYVRNEIEKVRVVRMFADGLSDCGLNLLVIENLAPCDAEVVNIVNRLIAVGEAAGDAVTNKRVLVVYIFNLNTMAPVEEQRRHQAMLQHLPRTKTINFRALGAKELRDCIVLEAATEGLKLSEADFAEIVGSIDVARSGCKNVHAKVLAYGTRS